MPVHKIRSWRGDGELVDVQIRSPRDAISFQCSECLGWECRPQEDCSDPNCPLYPYRPKVVRKPGRKSIARAEAA